MNTVVDWGRVGWWLATALVGLSALVACGDGVVRRIDRPLEDSLPQAPSGEGFAVIRCRPPTVGVHVDGAFHGYLDGYPAGVVPLRLGRRRLTLSAPGFYDHHAAIEVSARPVAIDTHLVAEVPMQ